MIERPRPRTCAASISTHRLRGKPKPVKDPDKSIEGWIPIAVTLDDESVTTADFIALAEDESGADLGQFFQVWLYEEGRPAPGNW